jgi:hypothetical protein
MADPVTVSLTTLPDRVELLEQALDSIYDQADWINVYLDGHVEVPAFLQRDKIGYLTRDEGGSWGARGKFYWAETVTGYHLTIDDDIVYPDDYAQRLIDAIERHRREAIVGVLGHRFVDLNKGFYDGRTTYTLRMPIPNDVAVHSVGSGTMGYHSDTIRFFIDRDFPTKNMEDLYVGVIAKRASVPCYVIARPPNWLHPLPVTGYSVYGEWQQKRDDRVQTEVARGEEPWPALPPIPHAVHAAIQRFYQAEIQRRTRAPT